MSHRRHSDANRAEPGSIPPATRRRLEWLRRRATRRKLVLLECAIVRHAPFAGCGRSLWDLMADQPWFRRPMLGRFLLGLIDDLFGRPSHNVLFEPAWRTPAAVALAARMDAARDFAAAPALSDLLEAAGCDDRDVLAHCRADRLHARGCWVVDRVLRRS